GSSFQIYPQIKFYGDITISLSTDRRNTFNSRNTIDRFFEWFRYLRLNNIWVGSRIRRTYINYGWVYGREITYAQIIKAYYTKNDNDDIHHNRQYRTI